MCVETSCKDEKYNCIAWALGFNHVRLWPERLWTTHVWPRPKPAVVTVQEFTDVFGLFGYDLDKDHTFEEGYEKIALYLIDGYPEHAAKQLMGSRKWTAKLGGGVDVRQDHLRDFPMYDPYYGGSCYGDPTYYYKRKLGISYPTFEQVGERHGVWPPQPRILSLYEAAG